MMCHCTRNYIGASRVGGVAADSTSEICPETHPNWDPDLIPAANKMFSPEHHIPSYPPWLLW